MKEIIRQKEQGAPIDEEEQQRQFREVSRIALRNGILPSALFLHTIMWMSDSKQWNGIKIITNNSILNKHERGNKNEKDIFF